MVRIGNEYLEVVISELGAQLQSIKSKRGTEFLYMGDQHWPRKAPVMFPYAGRLYDDRYFYRGKEYTLCNHGFAKDSEFEVESSEKSKAVFRLNSNEETLKHYPWEFSFHVEYCLCENRLEVSFRVENKDSEPMRFGLGIHPGFIVEKDDGNTELRIDKQAEQILLTEEGQLTGDKVPIESKIIGFSDARIRKSFLITGPSQVEMKTGNRRIVAYRGTMNHFLLWTKDGDSFVCIEPWVTLQDTGPKVSDIEKIETLCVLKKNKSAEYECSFAFFENPI